VAGLTTVNTVQGSAIRISASNNPLTITLNDNIRVTQADIAASNGVIHAIDGVLIPSTLDLNSLKDSATTTPRSGGISNFSYILLAGSIITLLAFAFSTLSYSRKIG
jgi:hypothetical protein